MLVSILLSTRERFDLMIESITSLYNKAHDPTRIELLLKLDDDNYEEYINRVDEIYKITPNVKIVISNRRNGYDSLHLFLNELAGVSEGEFLFVWNDDAKMISENWDVYVAEHCGKLCVLQIDNNHFSHPELSEHGAFIFPIIHRKYYEILNHISLNPHSDTWVHFVASFCDIEINEFRIFAYHDRADLTGNNDDEVYGEGLGRPDGYVSGHSLLHTQEQADLRSRDANKIFAYLMEN
jgi:hypothetical protein